MTTRGIINNNPLNIRRSRANNWKGQRPYQSDKEFVQFTDIFYGLRAAVITIRNYHRKHGAKTLADIINRWAPPTENHTTDYLRFVARESGIAPLQEVNFSDKSTIYCIIRAMAIYESNARNIDKEIKLAVNLTM